MPTILTNGIQLPDKGSVDWYNSMQSNYNLIDTHLGNTDTHVTAEDRANWNSKQGSLSQAQLDAISQVATNTSDIATLQSGKANASHTHSSSDITDIGDYATKQYVDNSISGLVDNAPDALNTLNELSAALNDDSNFASTVTTALAAKANSADLATVATSGSYNDLSNKPSIPTKTSDLTNDSNFVDTSNSAVASGITSAKVTSYDSHVADTDIHVTTADKSKWNNGVSQSYVFRYSSTALVASSTNSNTLLDNTDNLKVGDKVIDSDGVLFSITAIDTANSTFTIGTALVDLAKDSDVVHKSGDETISGEKNFNNTSTYYSGIKLEGTRVCHITADNVNDSVFSSSKCSFSILLPDSSKAIHIGQWTSSNNRIFLNKSYPYMLLSGGILGSNTYVPTGETNTAMLRLMAQINYADDTTKSVDVRLIQYDSAYSALYSNTDNVTSLGVAARRWSKIYGTEYYYGSNNVEFSTKFVTTDTNQTISGNKTFSSINGVEPSSLSLPSGNVSDFIDISSYFSNTGSGDTNSYTALANGWIYLRLGDISSCQVVLNDSSDRRLWGTSATGNVEQIIMPILKNTTLTTTWVTNSTVNVAIARFIPCQGNV